MNNPYKEIVNDGVTYQVYPITGRKACHLDRKVTEVAYSLREQRYSKSEMGAAIMHVFANMSEFEFDAIVAQTLDNVVRLGKNDEQNVKLTIENIFDFFVGNIDGLYGLLTDIWEAYELTPFKKAKVVNTGV